MRISGGEAKGRTLNFPSRSTQRPTTDFLREALFNILQMPAEQSFLDLFAGSGSVGLEAASRGAKAVTFVEKRKALVYAIHENVASCGYSEKCRIIHADLEAALNALCANQSRFDVIFADPPYQEGWIGETIKLLEKYPVLEADGLVILQHSIREQLTPLPDRWLLADQRKYGSNLLTFIRMAADDGREI